MRNYLVILVLPFVILLCLIALLAELVSLALPARKQIETPEYEDMEYERD
jgi:hypothetical protein